MKLTLPTFALVLSAAFITGGDALAQRRMGSIMDISSGAVSMFSDKTAARVGDLVTVIIEEEQEISNEESADSSKVSSLNYQMLNFDVKPDAFVTLPGLNTNRSDSFAGSANVEKSGTFSARLTAMVVDALPNGNLVIQGRRELRIEGDVKLIEFSGVVRRYDITRGNTVESELVADARISYAGQGPSRRATERHGVAGWLYRIMDWIWPF